MPAERPRATRTGGLWAAFLLCACRQHPSPSLELQLPGVERQSVDEAEKRSAEGGERAGKRTILLLPAASPRKNPASAVPPTLSVSSSSSASESASEAASEAASSSALVAVSLPSSALATPAEASGRFSVTRVRVVGSLNETLPPKDVAVIDRAFRCRLDAHAHLKDGAALTLLRDDSDELIGIRVDRPGAEPVVVVHLTHLGWFDSLGRRTDEGEWLARPLELSRVTSRFGMRLHPISRKNAAHHGVDYGAVIGTPVYAVAGGTVVAAGPAGSAGNRVELRHRGRTSLYLHLDRVAPEAQVGTRLLQGDVLGWVGTTGTSTGPHLHFEVRIGSIALDPLALLPSSAAPCPLDRHAELDALVRRLQQK